MAPLSACDSGPAHSAAGQDRVAGASDARPGYRCARVTKQYELVGKAEISPFAPSGTSEVSWRAGEVGPLPMAGIIDHGYDSRSP
jgi:hypothetical protein